MRALVDQEEGVGVDGVLSAVVFGRAEAVEGVDRAEGAGERERRDEPEVVGLGVGEWQLEWVARDLQLGSGGQGSLVLWGETREQLVDPVVGCDDQGGACWGTGPLDV